MIYFCLFIFFCLSEYKIDHRKAFRFLPTKLIEIEDDEKAKRLLKNELETVMTTLNMELRLIQKLIYELVQLKTLYFT